MNLLDRLLGHDTWMPRTLLVGLVLIGLSIAGPLRAVAVDPPGIEVSANRPAALPPPAPTHPLPDSLRIALASAKRVNAFLLRGCSGLTAAATPGPVHPDESSFPLRPARRLPDRIARELVALLLDSSRYTNIMYKCIWCPEAAYDFYAPGDTVTVTISGCTSISVRGGHAQSGMQLDDDATALARILVDAFPGDERALDLQRQAESHAAQRPRRSATETDFVRAGQAASVHAIDSTLAPARFDDWIRALAGKGAQIAWEANDCGEATGNPADSARVLPVCVEASARCADGREIRVAIAIGSDGRLIHDPPDLWWAMIDSAGVSHDYASLGALAQVVKAGRGKP